MTKIVYYYRGLIERGNGKPGYSWHEGYSENIDGHISFPWMTIKECRQDARRQGAIASFAPRMQPKTTADSISP